MTTKTLVFLIFININTTKSIISAAVVLTRPLLKRLINCAYTTKRFSSLGKSDVSKLR